MKKGQSEHIFNDLLPAIFIILIAFFAFNQLDEPSQGVLLPLEDSRAAQEFNNMLSTFLQTKVPTDLEAGSKGFSKLYLTEFSKRDYTYGDLLFQHTKTGDYKSRYLTHFSEGLQDHVSAIERTSAWDVKATFPNGEVTHLGPGKKPNFQPYVTKYVLPYKGTEVITLEATQWLT